MRILLVDDDPDIRLLVGTVLEHRGHEVVFAEDGEEGIRLAADIKPDVVLLDGIMPRLDGVEALRRLRLGDSTRDLPVVFLSALEDEASRQEVSTLGVHGLLSKPVDLDTLDAVLTGIAHTPDDG